MLTKARRIYLVWITSLMLGYFAYQQPLNKILSLIRESGIVSVSPSSMLENKSLVIQAVLPTLLLWLAIFVLWVVLFAIGIKCRFLDRISLCESRLEDSLFYIGMWIELIWASLFYATFHMPFATILVFIAMQCFAIRIIVLEHSRKEWIWIGILVTIGVACEFYTTRGFVLRAVLLILASKNIDYRKVFKYYLIVNIIAYAVIVVVSGLGISGVWMETDAFRTLEETSNRYVWGFNSPNTTHYNLIRLALVAMYLWWDRIKTWHVLVVFALNYILYMLTDSRTGFMVGVIACVLAMFFKYFKKIRDWKLWSYLAVALISFLIVFSLHFLQWNFYEYDVLHSCPDYVYKVGDILVGRIHQALKYTQDIEVSPFGTRQTGVYVDMGYIKFFLQEGFLIYIIYFVAIFKMLLVQNKKKDYAGYIIIVAISVRMLMESSFVPFVFQNIILLLFIGKWDELLMPIKEIKESKRL
jgi:hypothetical protein